MKYPVCFLTRIVSPGKYVVVSTDKEHVADVKSVEKRMMEEMQFDDPSEFHFSLQMCVAVVDSKGKFRRGVIEEKVGEDLYQVVLIDYGLAVQVSKSDMKVITNKQFMNVEPLAFTVVLHGLIPVKFVSLGANTKPRALKEWPPDSLTFVRSLFKNNDKVVVQSIFIQDRVVYGELFVRPNPDMKFVPLRLMLCKNEFCVYSETCFLKLCGFAPICDTRNVELETKMEFVRKWQRECLPYQNTNHFSLPVPVSLLQNKSPEKLSESFSPPQSGSKSSKQEDEDLEEVEQISGVSPPMPQIQGMGRGKLRLMLAEMRRAKEAASVKNRESPPQRDPFNRMETKVTRGRGLLLQKCLELKKAGRTCEQEKSGVSSSAVRSNTEGDGWGASSGTGKCGGAGSPSEINVTRSVSKLERAVIQRGEFSEFSDSNELSELSLSTEDGPPPLVGNLMTVQKKESSVSNRGDSRCQAELTNSEADVKSAESLKLASESSDSVGTKTGLRPSESRASVGSVKSVGTWCFERNVQKWPSSEGTTSSSWSPYVLFDDTFVEPANTFAELPVQHSIIKGLEKGGSFGNLSPIQRWAIPAIRKQLNAVLIGSPKTGKTLSYVIPVIDYVQDKSYFEELPQGNGPSVVIVASSSRVCESVYYLCRSLVENHTGKCSTNLERKNCVEIVMAHGGGCEKEVWVSLTNGCDILISTPPCLVRLLEMPIITNFERLTCLILDEIDIISQNPFRKSLRVILEKAQFSTKGRHYQKILCGEKLTSNVDAILKSHVKSYALVIGSYSEAVIYEGPKPTILLVDQARKPETLLAKLRDRTKTSKVLVVCELTPTAAALQDFLSVSGVPALLAHEGHLAEELRDTRRLWKACRSGIMVATDGVLNELNIKDVQLLVHYDLPSQSKTNFYLRYSTLENFLQDKQTFVKARVRRRSHVKERIRSSKVQDIIFVDEENHYQLPHITEFVVRLGGKVPPNVLEKCEEIRRQVEVNKRDVPICSNLLSFGRCRKRETCPRRHALIKDLDSCDRLPSSGWVNFLVLTSHDASRFSARLTHHVSAEGETSRLEDRFAEIPMRLSEFYKDEANLRVLGFPKTGDLCAVRTTVEDQEVFFRAKVLEYLSVDRHRRPVEVGVKLLDRGDEWRRKSVELYELPEELKEWAATAVDVVVVGVQPLDWDEGWSEAAKGFAAGLMGQRLEEGQYWSGRVVLALRDTVFLEPIRRKQYLPELSVEVFDLVVDRELVNGRMASGNQEHLGRVQRACGEAGMEVARRGGQKAKDSTVVQPQWAFFDGEHVQVKFLAAESPAMVFLQASKFEKSVQELEEECQKEGARTAAEARGRKGRRGSGGGRELSVGKFCLAVCEEGKWNRGRIESEREKEWEVFFVDHGDFLFVAKADVVPISENLLLRLPCQAIECQLVGVEAEEECPLEVLREIYSFSEDGREELCAHIVRRDLKAAVTKGRKYSLNLLNLRGTSLNKMLVDRKLVRAVEAEREYLEDADAGAEDVHQEEGQEEEEEEEKTEDRRAELKVSLDDNTLAGYFSNLGDDVFEDEDGQTFLTEVFGSSAPSQENAKDKGQERASSASEEPKKPTSAPAPPVQPAQQTELDLTQRQKLQLRSREDVLTPQVLWCQNQSEVHLKILLGGLQDYALECTVGNLSFRCFVGEKFYAMDLRLYGAVNPSLTRVSVKAFHVLAVLTKLASPPWPRLHADEGRLRWINPDLETLPDADGAFADSIAAAKLEMECGAVRKGTRDEEVFPCSDSEESEAAEAESSSEEDS